eukprot:5377942-Ditylum_brightwellii.AAC.1
MNPSLIGEKRIPDTGSTNISIESNNKSQQDSYPDLSPKCIPLYDAILVTYHCFKLAPIAEIPTNQCLLWTAKLRRTTALANKTTPHIAETFDTTGVTNLNNLYFAVATSICKTSESTTHKTTDDPADTWEEQNKRKLENY